MDATQRIYILGIIFLTLWISLILFLLKDLFFPCCDKRYKIYKLVENTGDAGVERSEFFEGELLVGSNA